MSYELILRATYENNKEVLYKSPNINGDFVIRGYTNPNDAPPLHRAGIINDACFNLLSSTNTYPNVSIDTINTSNATLASEDFTISFWCNIQKDSIAKNTVLFSATDGNNYSWSTTKGTFLLLGNPVRLLYDNTTYLTSKNTLKLVDGKNHFICIERKNDTLYVFIDGKLEIEDDIATRFGVAHYPFANVKFSVGNGSAEDSDGTNTLKRSMLVDGYTLIKGICIWDKEFTPPKRDAWDLISNGYLDTTGLAYYHKKIVEYINKNSSVRQNNHLYNKDDIVRFNNVWIKCMIGGTTASTPPTLTTEEIGTTITDGGVTWTVVKYALTTDVPPLASALATPRKIELTGKAEGSTSFDGSSDASINVTSVNADTATTATTANSLKETSDRPASANVTYEDGKIRYFLATASMHEGKPPGGDGPVIHLAWDRPQWETQMAINNPSGHIQTRGQNYGTWRSWITVLDSDNYNNYAPTKTGDGASGTWGISISGKANTASKLATPRKIELTGNVTGSANFDGSKDIQIATSLSDPYLPLAGGEVTGAVNFAGGATGNWTGTVRGGNVAFEDKIIKDFDSKQDQSLDFIFNCNIGNYPVYLVSVGTMFYRNTGSSQRFINFGVAALYPGSWDIKWLYTKENHNFIDYVGNTYAITVKDKAPLTINVSWKAQSQDANTTYTSTSVWVKSIGE